MSAVGVATAGAFHGARVPSSRRHRAASVPRGSHAPQPFRPRRFSRPRRLAPPPGSWVCFTPLPRPGFALQGFSPRPQPRRLVGDAVPSRRLAPRRCRCCHRRHVAAPRPQGFESAVESVIAAPGFSHRDDPLPSWASPPPGAPSRRRANAFTSAAARGLGARWSGPRCADLQQLSPSSPTSSREAADLPEVFACPSVSRRPARPPLSSRRLNRAANRFRIETLCSGCASAAHARRASSTRVFARLALWTRL